MTRSRPIFVRKQRHQFFETWSYSFVIKIVWITAKIVLYSNSKMTIQTKSMMRRRVNRARPSGLV